MRYLGVSIVAALLLSSAAAAETFTVYANSLTFAPAVLEVAPGDTIVWQYNSGYPHTVTSGSDCNADGLFHSPLNGSYPTFTWEVPEDLTVDIPYFCAPHCAAGMTGLIIVTPTQPPCPEDVNGDGYVAVTDILMVIKGWGPCADCPADVNGDGSVNVSDILLVIAAWGGCP